MDTIEVGHPAIEGALRIFSRSVPDTTYRASKALAILLDGINKSSWKEVAWRFSRLTGDGFPVEFCFSSFSNSLRYTSELAEPEIAEKDRILLADQKLQLLETRLIPKNVINTFRKIQNRGDLEFGTWIGGSHSKDKDFYKLYLETPGESKSLADELLGINFTQVTLFPGDRKKLRMLAYEPNTGDIELYFRTSAVEPWQFGHILHYIGLQSEEKNLFELIQEAYGRHEKTQIPMTKQGFSIKISQNKPIAFSLFFFARSIFGSDKNIRSKLLNLANTKGWDFTVYEILSEPMADRTGWKTYHGIISFIVSLHDPPGLQIGLRPPG